jgi:hypothetical protein
VSFLKKPFQVEIHILLKMKEDNWQSATRALKEGLIQGSCGETLLQHRTKESEKQPPNKAPLSLDQTITNLNKILAEMNQEREKKVRETAT